MLTRTTRSSELYLTRAVLDCGIGASVQEELNKALPFSKARGDHQRCPAGAILHYVRSHLRVKKDL